jgi:methanogenic corrinoid protein MtbC1
LSTSLSILARLEQTFADVSGIDEMRECAQRALSEGVPPLRIVDSMRKGLATAGEKYERGEFFLSDLVMVGLMAKELGNTLEPHIRGGDEKFLAKVAIGTVKGDLHDIGKNLVSTMLSSAGFEIIDLGVDVPQERFAQAIQAENPKIVAFSCLLTVAIDAMKNTMNHLKQLGLREKVGVLVGGRPITLEFAQEIGAEGYGADAVEAVDEARKMVAESKRERN